MLTSSEKNKRFKTYHPGHRIEYRELNNGEIEIEIDRAYTPGHGRNFIFRLEDHMVRPMSGQKNGGNSPKDWYKALNEQEMLDVMQVITAYYRNHSTDPDGMKTGAAVVIKNPAPKTPADEHLIFVGTNTTNDTYRHGSKHCAERMALDNATRWLNLHYPDQKNERFCGPLFVMGGREADPSLPEDKGVAGICPCGSCTDNAARYMDPESVVYAFPHTDGWKYLKLNDTAQYYGDIAKNAIWKTTVGHLNNKREIDLPPEVSELRGLEWIASKLVGYKTPGGSEEAAIQAYNNKKEGRKSVPELDVITVDGLPDVEGLNQFMLNELLETLSTRVVRDVGDKASQEEILHWLETRVEKVRCTVIQTDDGCYHYGKDSQTGSEKAFPNAETGAISAAIDSLGIGGIQRVWSMEINPKAIMNGQMFTATKEALERIHKRRTKEKDEENSERKVAVCEMLLNDGTMPREKLQEIADQFTFSLEELYVSGFGGSGIEQKHEHSALILQKPFTARAERGTTGATRN